MSVGKQAQILNASQERAVLAFLSTRRHAARDTAIFLLSIKSGLRAKEIASVTWRMVVDSSGEVGDVIRLEDKAAKGQSGRVIPMNRNLKAALVNLYSLTGGILDLETSVIRSERGGAMLPHSLVGWFADLYAKLGLTGCTSHSGRRSFVTRAAKKVVEAGGTLRDVQQLAGHSSLVTTQRYIEGDSDAKRKLVDLI